VPPKNRLGGEKKRRGERGPRAHPAAGENIKSIDARDEGNEVNEMAKIRDEPSWMNGVKSARNQRCEHDEGGTVVIVGIARDNDLRAGKPCCVGCERVVGVFEKLKFIP